MKKSFCLMSVVLFCALSAGTLSAAGNITVERVWPRQILYAPGERAEVTVTLRNPRATLAQARLLVELLYAFDRISVLFDEDITMLGKERREIPLTFTVDGRHRGWEVRARVFKGEREVSRGREFFVVTDSPWSVGHYYFWLWSYGLDVQAKVARFRETYSVVVEQFGWSPSHVGDIIPPTETWISTTKYRECKATIKALIRLAQEHGIRVLSYFWGQDAGPQGFEFARTHPEWVRRGRDGRWLAEYNVKMLDKLEDDAFRFRLRGEVGAPGCDRPPTLWYHVKYDWHNLDVVKHHASQLIRLRKELGFDGVRYDYWLISPLSPDIHGQLPVDFLSPDELGLRNHSLVTKIVREAVPDFMFGHNYCRYALAVRWPRTWEYLSPGRFMLMEYSITLWRPGHMLNDWEYFRHRVKKESHFVLDSGGYFYVHMCRAGVIQTPLAYQYQAAIILASRGNISAHSEVAWSAFGGAPYSPLGGVGVRRVNAFALRFADQIFDRALRELPDVEKKVSVADDRLWWKEYVYTHQFRGHENWVIHLINPPLSNTPDPKMKEAPAPRKDVQITLTPPRGKEIGQAWWISPDEEEWATRLTVKGNRITVPQVKVWGVVCIEWR